METIEAIMTRRSIRRFDDRDIPGGTAETLLRAAMAAPSAGNQRPWRFVTVTDRVTLDLLAAATPYAAPMGEAPLGIVVLGDTEELRFPEHWEHDCSAAVQNVLLAAHAIGLGAVWMAVHPDPERVANVSKVLGSATPIVPFAMIALGYPEQPGPVVDRYEPDWVREERWS